MFLGSGAFAIVVAALWLGNARSPLPVVQFPDGKTSRVLKVSYGTNHVLVAEPMWKQAIRKVLPEMLEKSLGRMNRPARTTPYDSLAIFMEPVTTDSVTVQVVFPDGTTAQTPWYRATRGPIVFTSYPREEKELRLRFEGVEVKIPNPRRVRKASWSGGPIPQTNCAFGTEVVLDRWVFWDLFRPGEMFFRTRSLNGGPTGWMQWKTTLFDPWGNWQGADYTRSPTLPGATTNRHFKVVAEGHEYIFAGFVSAPADEEYLLLPLNQRATNWGVRFLVLLGAGRYQVSKGFEIQNIKSTSPQTNAVTGNGSSWLVETPEAALLSISARPVFGLRLRERLDRNGGRIFGGGRAGTVTKQHLVAQLFASRLPVTTTNLEAEVVVHWPGVEFFVEKP